MKKLTDTRIYAYDGEGVLTGCQYAEERPDGKPMIPLGWVTAEPPQEKEGYRIVWDGSAWGYNEIATPSQAEPTEEELLGRTLRAELDEKERYLSDTDYIVIKCMEQGLDMETEYPGVKAKRQEARDRINGIRSKLGS